jgi:hypothetical protein
LAENLVRQVSASGEQLPLKPAHHHDNLKPKILQLASSMMQYVSFLRGLKYDAVCEFSSRPESPAIGGASERGGVGVSGVLIEATRLESSASQHAILAEA